MTYYSTKNGVIWGGFSVENWCKFFFYQSSTDTFYCSKKCLYKLLLGVLFKRNNFHWNLFLMINCNNERKNHFEAIYNFYYNVKYDSKSICTNLVDSLKLLAENNVLNQFSFNFLGIITLSKWLLFYVQNTIVPYWQVLI